MSKTYLGTSGVVVMPVIDDTTTPVDNVYDLGDVVLRSVDDPEDTSGTSSPHNWSYNSETGYIEGIFTERSSEGYIYGGDATTALWLDDDIVADVTLTFDRGSSQGPLNEHYWITRQKRLFYMRVVQGNDTYTTNFNSSIGDIDLSIPAAPGTATVTLQNFDFRHEYIFIYAYAAGASGTRTFKPRIISITYKYHDYKLSPVKLKGAESN